MTTYTGLAFLSRCRQSIRSIHTHITRRGSSLSGEQKKIPECTVAQRVECKNKCVRRQRSGQTHEIYYLHDLTILVNFWAPISRGKDTNNTGSSSRVQCVCLIILLIYVIIRDDCRPACLHVIVAWHNLPTTEIVIKMCVYRCALLLTHLGAQLLQSSLLQQYALTARLSLRVIFTGVVCVLA